MLSTGSLFLIRSPGSTTVSVYVGLCALMPASSDTLLAEVVNEMYGVGSHIAWLMCVCDDNLRAS